MGRSQTPERSPPPPRPSARSRPRDKLSSHSRADVPTPAPAPAVTSSAPERRSSKEPCPKFQLDMCSPLFNTCKCGLHKTEHGAPRLFRSDSFSGRPVRPKRLSGAQAAMNRWGIPKSKSRLRANTQRRRDAKASQERRLRAATKA